MHVFLFDFGCVSASACIPVWVCILPVCVSVCVVRWILENGAFDFLVASATNPSVLGDQMLCTTACLS